MLRERVRALTERLATNEEAHKAAMRLLAVVNQADTGNND